MVGGASYTYLCSVKWTCDNVIAVRVPRPPRHSSGPLMASLLARALCLLALAGRCSADTAAVDRFRTYLRIRTAQPTPDYEAAAAFLTQQGRDIGCVATSEQASRCVRVPEDRADCSWRCRLEVEVLRYAPHKPLVLLTWQGSEAGLESIMLNSRAHRRLTSLAWSLFLTQLPRLRHGRGARRVVVLEPRPVRCGTGRRGPHLC